MTRVTSTDSTTDAARTAERAAARLERAAGAAASKASLLSRPVLAWSSARIAPVDVIEIFARAAALAKPRTLWMHPDAGSAIVAVGSAWRCETEGPTRFKNVNLAWRTFIDAAVGEGDPDDEAGPPVAMAGFAFAPGPAGGREWEGFPNGELTLPALTVRQTRSGAFLTLAVVIDPQSGAPERDRLIETWWSLAAHAARVETPHAERRRIVDEQPSAVQWKADVAAAAAAVRSGAMRKVVLARQVKIANVGAGEADVIRRMRDGYPGCTVFAAGRGDRCFVGATPELLVRVEGGTVTTGALAGSAPRGATPDEDRGFGSALLASRKDRLEHAVVVDDLRQTIDEVCTDVSAGATPSLLRVANVQHLFTPITGRLRDLCVLDLVERLHPSPAVGGLPRDAALAWVNRHEGFDRGWYAGPIGWVDHRGEGEFAVAIRSALLRGREALLFAGCGIMGDSDPDLEYTESQLKLQSMLSALE